MLKYIAKRLLLCLFILFGVSVIIYTLIRMLPADYVDQQLSSQQFQGVVDEEDVARMKELYGIGDNSFKGIIGGYFKWLGNMIKGDLGKSFLYKEDVTTIIGRDMWVSFWIALVAFVLQIIIAIPLGIKAATNQYGPFDYTASVFSIIGISLPSFFFAAILMKVFAVDLGWLPLQGLSDATTDFTSSIDIMIDRVKHLIMPMTVLVFLSIGGLMRHTRTNTLEVLNSDYIRTARAKGLSEKRVINKHAFRNTLIPIVTMLAGLLPSLFGGALVMETVFAIPGIGYKAFKAMQVGDIPFVMGYNMFLAVLTVIGTLLADIAYSIVDPRVKITK